MFGFNFSIMNSNFSKDLFQFFKCVNNFSTQGPATGPTKVLVEALDISFKRSFHYQAQAHLKFKFQLGAEASVDNITSKLTNFPLERLYKTCFRQVFRISLINEKVF